MGPRHGDISRDGPQDIDLAEFGDDESSDTVPCPSCGADIYEDADRCPACGDFVVLRARGSSSRWWWILAVLAAAAVAVYLAMRFQST